ncbi:hypothetical protein HK101_004418 [Irineochytrium annulatum]|nr:hypothetical protein HK101_004418 [Irineochytrium annulatum]
MEAGVGARKTKGVVHKVVEDDGADDQYGKPVITPGTGTGDKIEHFAVKPGTVLILTPAKNTEWQWKAYFNRVKALTYPPELISFGFLVSDSTDRTMEKLEGEIRQISHLPYRRFTLSTLNFNSPIGTGIERHAVASQTRRRAILAASRNHLLNLALRDEEHVLWLDADLRDHPDTLIEDLLSRNKSILAANCVSYGGQSPGGYGSYDLNTWSETPESLAYLATLPPSQLVFEGYAEFPTKRQYLNDLIGRTDVGDVVEVHGVGGTVLLVKADVHRMGAVFPAFSFEHAIETEGFAKMASAMGVKAYGLPNYPVVH